MHKNNTIEFVTTWLNLFGFLFVWLMRGVLCMAWLFFFFSFIFKKLDSNKCLHHKCWLFPLVSCSQQFQGLIEMFPWEQDVASVWERRATDEATLWKMLPWGLYLCPLGTAEMFALLCSLISSCMNEPFWTNAPLSLGCSETETPSGQSSLLHYESTMELTSESETNRKLV